MSEGMHSNPGNAGTRKRSRLALIVGGAALAVVATAVSIQFLRPQPGTAAEDRGDKPGPGTASVRQPSESAGELQALARVGNITISREKVAAECMERYGLEVLDKMVNRAIIEQACHDRGVVITREEVDNEVIEIAKKFNLDPGNWLKMLKAERNITEAQYKRDIIWPMLALKKLAGAEVVLSEDDLKRAFIRDYGPRVECKMIMCDNIRRANDVWNKAKADPEEFGRLARENSIEPTSRALDGDVPPIRRFSGNDNLEREAFKLKPNEISGVIEVGAPPNKKFVILFCKGRTEQVVSSLDEVREDLSKQLKEEKTQEAVAQVFEQIKKEVKVINYATNKTSGGEAPEKGIRQTSGAAPARGPSNEGAARVGGGPRKSPN